MISKSLLRGYGYAFVATIAGSTVYIFSKAALTEVSLSQFGFYWFLFAIFWNSVYALSIPEHRKFKPISRKSFKVMVWIGLIEIVATTTFYWAISIASNAAIPSFLRNMEYIFVTLMGVLLLNERFVRLEIFGVFLTLAGVMVISYSKETTFSSFITGTSGLMVVSTVFYAIRTLTAKKHIETVTPIILAINRAVFLFVFAAIVIIVFNQQLIISRYAFINILIGSFLGPFITSLGQYNALKHIEASRSAILQSTTALFVIVGAYLYFGKLPLHYQIAGGLFTIIGAILLIIGRKIHLNALYRKKKA